MEIQSKKIHIDFDLEEYMQEMHFEIDARSFAEGDGSFKEDVFTDLVIAMLADSGDTEGQLLCNYSRLSDKGTTEVKINAYAIKEDYETLDLFVTFYRDTNSLYSVTKTELEQHIKHISKFAGGALKGHADLIDVSHPASKLANEIRKHFRELDRINLFVLTNGSVPFDPPEDFKIKGLEEVAVIIHVWDIERICRLARSKSGREPILIDFEEKFGLNIPCLKMPVINDIYDCYLAIIPGKVLSLLYRNYSTRLLESNVRAFLQQTGKINKGIKDTILNRPHMFLTYNNGLAVTAQGITTKIEGGQLCITSIKDLQIVNVGQTTASLFHTEKKNKANLDDVYVQMKLTVIRNEEQKMSEVPKISRFANTQNKVYDLDFTSNHPYLIRLEELSRTTFATDPENVNKQTLWFFERGKGQYQEMINKESKVSNQDAFRIKYPKSQIVTKSDIAKYVNIWRLLPHIVSKGSQKNYPFFLESIQKEFTKVLPNRIYFQDLIANAILFIKSDEIFGRKNKNAIGDTNLRSYTVAYTLSLFHYHTGNKLNLKYLWDMQKVPEEVCLIIGEMMKKVYKFLAGREGLVSEIAKSEKCWEELKNSGIALDFEVPDYCLFTEEAFIERYSDKTDTLKEAIFYDNLNKITEAGLKFWDGLPIWLINRDDFSSAKMSFADSIRKKLKSEGQLTEIEIKQGLELLDAVRETGTALNTIKSFSKIDNEVLTDTIAAFNRISAITDENWKRMISLGEQRGILESREISILKSVVRKLKIKEKIDLKTFVILDVIFEKVRKFGIKV